MENINTPFRVSYGTNEYVQYHHGGEKSKLIISVPHGGSMKPTSIPNRDESDHAVKNGGNIKISVIKDLYTKELGLLLRDEIIQLTSSEHAPHLIICDLHRCKIDANRGIEEATLQNEDSIIAYKEYHDFLSLASRTVDVGLMVDLHGQTHPEEWVELGYLITKGALNQDSYNKEKCSMRSLCTTSKFPLKDLICGDCSLGHFLQSEGVNTIPSPVNPKTNGNYFSGAYNIFEHGSFNTGSVDAVQIETPRKYRNKDAAPAYVKALARAIVNFINLHYESM